MKFDKRFDGFNIVATFNQTNVELKWDILHADLLVLITFNQTNVELKFWLIVAEETPFNF